MRTVLRLDGFRFFFYTDERQEPAHIHARRAADEAKLWLHPVSLARNEGFNAATLNRLHSIVRDNQTLFLEAWDEYFTS